MPACARATARVVVTGTDGVMSLPLRRICARVDSANSQEVRIHFVTLAGFYGWQFLIGRIIVLAKNIDELKKIRSDCYSLVTTRASISAGTSAIPTPGVDIAADVALLLYLIPEINQRFGLSEDQIKGYSPAKQQLIYQLIKRAGLALVGQAISKTLITQALKKVAGRAAVKQVLKFVPFVGWAANAAIGFGAMKYVGNSHVDDCFSVCEGILDEGSCD